MKEIILDKLKEIEEKEDVRIIMAVESGSRAWGFPSYDSDFDVRFVYVRKLEDYLKLEKIKDMIEWQLDEKLDINGWDLKKALQLMYDSNPTIFEWCSSPIVYRSSETFEELKNIKDEYYSRKKNIYHYWHMAINNYENYLKEDNVRLKKYFYVLRPLLAAKWIIDKKTFPSMLFSELVDAELSDELRGIVDKLLEMKFKSSEMGISTRIKELDDFINEELDLIKKAADEEKMEKHSFDTLDNIFYRTVVDANSKRQ